MLLPKGQLLRCVKPLNSIQRKLFEVAFVSDDEAALELNRIYTVRDSRLVETSRGAFVGVLLEEIVMRRVVSSDPDTEPKEPTFNAERFELVDPAAIDSLRALLGASIWNTRTDG